MRASSLRPLVAPLAAALVTVAGGAVLWAGLSRTSVLGGDAPLTGRLPVVAQPVVVTVPGLSGLAGGEFTVRAAGPAGRPVFVGVGRADDVEAYLGDVARAEVTALAPDGTLRVARRPGAGSLPDPAGVDVWAAAAHGTGGATLTWPRTGGRWRVLVAVDGRTPPSGVEVTWAGRAASSSPALIAVGAVVVAAGLAGLLAIRSARVQARRAGRRRPVNRRRDAAPRSREVADRPRDTAEPSRGVAERPRSERVRRERLERSRLEQAERPERAARTRRPERSGDPAPAEDAGWTPGGETAEDAEATTLIQPFRRRRPGEEE